MIPSIMMRSLVFVFFFARLVVCEYPTVPCESLSAVSCGWTVNSMGLAPQNGLYYKNDSLTKDCSVGFRNYSDVNLYGNWSCWARSTDRENGYLIKSENYNYRRGLTLKDGDVQVEENKSPQFDANNESVLGKTLKIGCRFGKNVDFHWLWNEEPVKIGGRYRLTNNEEGMVSTDCSIEIRNLQAIDSARWRCSTYVNSWKGHAHTIPLHIRLSSLIPSSSSSAAAVVVHPQSQEVSIGQALRLDCEFEQAVDCAWFINGLRVNVQYRFAFVNYNGRDMSKDCSIRVARVSWLELGEWTCWSVGSDTRRATKSKSAVIKEKSMASFSKVDVEVRVQMKATVGKEAVLLCTPLTDNNITSCYWFRNGVPVLISGRYAFIGQHCSISINPVSPLDQAQWTCQIQQTKQVTLHHFQLHTIQNGQRSSPKSHLQTGNNMSAPFRTEQLTSTMGEINVRDKKVFVVKNVNKSDEEVVKKTKEVDSSSCSSFFWPLVIVSSVAFCLAILAGFLLWVNRKLGNRCDIDSTSTSTL